MVFFTLIFSTLMANAQPAANEARLNELDARLKALEQQQKDATQSLTDEVARLKTGSSVPELQNLSFMGMGAAASKVYFSKTPLSIGGYGEIVYQDPRGGSAGNTSDVYRIVPYISYRFSDKIIFNSEIEFEHVNTVAVEFAYLDFMLMPELAIRAGHLLVPVGMTNLKHEPNYFYTVSRPEIETELIPSTWHENGVMLFGETGPIRYHLGVVNGFRAALAPSAANSQRWIRSFRQSGSQAQTEDLGYVARLEWIPDTNLEVGASYYVGDSGQLLTDTLGGARIQIWEAHARWAYRGLEMDALYAGGTLKDIAFTPAQTLPGEEVAGYYATLAYDVLQGRASGGALKVFTRYSTYDLNKKAQSEATGGRDKSLDREIWSFGVNYFPDPNVVIKANYDSRDNAAAGYDDRFELGLGLVF